MHEVMTGIAALALAGAAVFTLPASAAEHQGGAKTHAGRAAQSTEFSSQRRHWRGGHYGRYYGPRRYWGPRYGYYGGYRPYGYGGYPYGSYYGGYGYGYPTYAYSLYANAYGTPVLPGPFPAGYANPMFATGLTPLGVQAGLTDAYLMSSTRKAGTAYVPATLATPFVSRFAVFGTDGWIEVRDKAHVEAPDGWVVTEGWKNQPITVREVSPAEPVRDIGHRGFERRAVGDIGAYRVYLFARDGRVEIENTDARTGHRQRRRTRGADPRTATGHDRDQAVEPCHLTSLLMA